MTRPSKKAHEKRLATRFLEGWLPHTSLDEDERPDFRVRRAEGDIALEVTAYHAQTPEGSTGRPRVAVEVRRTDRQQRAAGAVTETHPGPLALC